MTIIEVMMQAHSVRRFCIQMCLFSVVFCGQYVFGGVDEWLRNYDNRGETSAGCIRIPKTIQQ